MSIRTKFPYPAAVRTTSRRFSRQSSYESPSPRAVSLTLTLESSPASSIAANTASYAWPTARVSSSCVISSPSTSTVAIFPPRFSPRTHSTASASVAPAMYRDEKSCTTGFGTAGKRRTRTESSSDTGAAILRRGVVQLRRREYGRKDHCGATTQSRRRNDAVDRRGRRGIQGRRREGVGARGCAVRCRRASADAESPVGRGRRGERASDDRVLPRNGARRAGDARADAEDELRPVRRFPGSQQGARDRAPAGRTWDGAGESVRALVRRGPRRRNVREGAEAADERAGGGGGGMVLEAHRRGRHRRAPARSPGR